jgi:hypothetical protein
MIATAAIRTEVKSRSRGSERDGTSLTEMHFESTS